MSTIDRRSLRHDEASLLSRSGSFWPGSMVDKSLFMKMLLHVLNVEAQLDIQTERWEEQLTASGGVKGAETVLGTLARPRQEDERLVATSLTASQAEPKGIFTNPDRSL
eukprot:6472131-Amphidinium_carterae.1